MIAGAFVAALATPARADERVGVGDAVVGVDAPPTIAPPAGPAPELPNAEGPSIDEGPPGPPRTRIVDERMRALVGQRAALTETEARIKKEGFYFTGLPLANFDPNFGVGFGIRGNLFDNGKRDNPLFRYAPYEKRLSLTLFATTGGLQFHWLDFDAPFVRGSAYRLRAQAIFEQNVDRHYFGIGARSLGALRYPGAPGSFTSLDDYEQQQRRVAPNGTTYSRYDRFFFRRPIGLFGVERSFLGGRLRPLIGLGIGFSTIRDFAGKSVSSGNVDAISAPTRLTEDCRVGRIVGCAGGWDNYVRVGIAYDTRDYEPDPTSGVFLDAEADFGTAALGSGYVYAKAMGAARAYLSPFPRLAKLVVALRGVYQIASLETPFFSMNIMPFTEDPKTGLGGFRTVRGFSQDRFVGPVMALANAEIRWTFTTFDVLRQHFGLMLVPFVDFGRVFDRVADTTLSGFRRGQGAGFRVAWNQATIVMLDYGTSNEGSALYVNFGHIF